jgi:hypothetical protein
VAGVALSGWVIADNAAVLAIAMTALVKSSLGAGFWVIQFADAGVALSDVFVTVGHAMSRIVVTREGTTGLVAIAAIGALSLSALHRLLISEGRERGVSQWPEL